MKDLVGELKARVELGRGEHWTFSPRTPSLRAGDAGRAQPRGAADSSLRLSEVSKVAESSQGDVYGTAKIQPAGALDAAAELARLKAEVEQCRKCSLGHHRLNPAFGVGSPDARVVFIGEGPGFDEDRLGEPFVGKAGQLLDKILASIGLSRQTVYIANIVKCHPMRDPEHPELRGNDRPPEPEEISACLGYLEKQLEWIRPKIIVTLGAVAARVMLRTHSGVTALRGRWQERPVWTFGPPVKILPTYHPAALLRNPKLKIDVWEDMKSLKKELEST